MKKKIKKENQKQLQKDFLTSDINFNNSFKSKFKKIIIPTITILMITATAIVLVFILRNEL